jgi:L-fuculose-phosphate aldolase
MSDVQKKKKLMHGYIGVKFQADKLSEGLPFEDADLYLAFKRTCDRLEAYDMTPANGGNVSIRHGNGLLISASGSNLGCLEKNELTFSSESIMHWLIYQNHPEAQAIIHAHDEFATRPELLAGEVEESKREEPYGTIELAHIAIVTFKRAKQIIVLKNHGYVAIGPDLDKTCDLVVDTHLKLLGKREA